tara:strand:- start:332 stop:655 length:324 start_codon:yes stop_codon:yes gene_type:complete
MAQHTKAKVIAIDGSFTGSVVKIGAVSGSDGDNGAILDRVTFGTLINDSGEVTKVNYETTGSQTNLQIYTGEINIKPGTFLEGPIVAFHVKDGTHSPAVVYYTDEIN